MNNQKKTFFPILGTSLLFDMVNPAIYYCAMNNVKCYAGLLFGGVLLLGLTISNIGPSTVHISAEEFRFSPANVVIPAFQDVRFVLRNQGRELHVFHAPFLEKKAVSIVWESPASPSLDGNSISLSVGESVSFVAKFPPGLYSFRCKTLGYRGMEGLINVRKEE